MDLSPVLRVLWCLSAIAPVAVLARLIRERLLQSVPYGSFTAMLLAGLAQDAILSRSGDYRSHSYALAWEITAPFVLFAQASAAVAAYRAIAGLYPKIGRFAVRLFVGSLGATALACCLGLPFETHRIAGSDVAVRTLFLLYRWMNSLMAGGLLLAVAYLARYPRPLKVMPRNLVLHARLLCAYFGFCSAVPFILNLVPLGGATWAQIALQACLIALYLTWTFRLSRAGERTESWPHIDDRILEHIERRNRAVLQFGAALTDSALRHATGRR